MKRHFYIPMLFLLAMGAVQQSSAQESLSGRASVIDGDTIEIHGTRIRLRAVDAPEAAQLCKDHKGQSWRCGQQAALALDQFIGQRVIHCNELGTDKYRRTLARCRIGREDLGAWLVSEGWAIAYLDRKGLYRDAQDLAEASKHGIWSGDFERPAEWRKKNGRRKNSN